MFKRVPVNLAEDVVVGGIARLGAVHISGFGASLEMWGTPGSGGVDADR